jgi:hypothetical protein
LRNEGRRGLMDLNRSRSIFTRFNTHARVLPRTTRSSSPVFMNWSKLGPSSRRSLNVRAVAMLLSHFLCASRLPCRWTMSIEKETGILYYSEDEADADDNGSSYYVSQLSVLNHQPTSLDAITCGTLRDNRLN